ncbi:epimerase, partial [Planktotalea sp.]|uniref:epimerase n=1 Tax=Planktotalea sp. TaxID=2029877 RepID=UPI003297BEB9
FTEAGWNVRLFDRKTDSLETAARGVDVIVNAWHIPYPQWQKKMLSMHKSVHRAALANDATVIIPGNVYVFGESTPSPWSETSPYRARNPLGKIRIEMERAYRDAGVRTIVLRAGDFIDTEANGNWFDMIIAKKIGKGKMTSPGNPDIEHAWGFLPDITRAAVELAEKRDELERFCDVCFPGYSLSLAELAAACGLARGHDVKVKQMKWWPLRLVWPFMADMKYIFEMRYLWFTPHRLDGAKFAKLLPDFKPTPLLEAMRQATEFAPLPEGQMPTGAKVTA